MLRIGLTGGIASGKTTVSSELARLGAIVIDADVLAREVVEPGTTGLEQVVDRFGPDVLSDDGVLDRAALAALVFSDDEARGDLNSIIHPLVRQRAQELEHQSPDDAVVVHVIPLLVETAQENSFDAVLVVDVPVQLQLDRLMARNALTKEQALARVRAQADRQQRRRAATWIIDNSGPLPQTLAAVRSLWDGAIAEGHPS